MRGLAEVLAMCAWNWGYGKLPRSGCFRAGAETGAVNPLR